MEHEQLEVASPFGYDEVIAIGRPFYRLYVLVVVLGDLYGILFFKIDVPGIFRTTAVGGEGNFFTIRTPLGVGIVGHAVGELFGFASSQRDAVNVSHQVKGNGLSIGADVQRHPGAFVDLKFDFALGLQGQGLFGVFFGRHFCGVFFDRILRLQHDSAAETNQQ